MTRDHTVVEEKIRDGRLTPNEAAQHPDRHVLTRAMGLGPTIEGDIFPYDLIEGDLLLLCTDGLTKMLTDERILQTALPHRHNPPPLYRGPDRGGAQGRGDRQCDRSGLH